MVQKLDFNRNIRQLIFWPVILLTLLAGTFCVLNSTVYFENTPDDNVLMDSAGFASDKLDISRSPQTSYLYSLSLISSDSCDSSLARLNLFLYTPFASGQAASRLSFIEVYLC
jgi:hypothetical protein